jgi:lipid A disaccharide synthetase
MKNLRLNILNVKKTKYRRIVTSNSSIVNIIAVNDIMPEFLEEYVKICNVPTFIEQFTNQIDCVNNLVIPPYDEQIGIMNTMNELNENVDISDISPYLMYYMSNKDVEKVKELLLDYQKYIYYLHSILELINNVSS